MDKKIATELSAQEYLAVCNAVRSRAQTLHNLADEYEGSDAGPVYRQAGNSYSKLLAKLQKELLFDNGGIL